MSTSDPQSLTVNAEQLRSDADAVPGHGPLAGDVPAPELIARIANELFTALPGSLDLPSALGNEATLSPPTSFPGTAPAFQPEIPLPTDKHFPTLPGSIGPAQVAPVSANYQAAPPAVPGALATVVEDLPVQPVEFSFLQEARPLFTGQLPTSRSPYSSATLDSTAVPQSALQQGTGIFGTGPLEIPQPATTPQTPSLPASGAPSYPATKQAPLPAFSFLEERRPLFSDERSLPDVVPTTPSHELHTVPSFELDLSNNFERAPEIAGLTNLSSFAFFEAVRPLEPEGVVGHFEPRSFEEDVPRNLDVTAYPFDAETIKRDFPILRERVNGRPLVWLDNAATTQKPQAVIDRLKYFYEHENSNVHRAAHELAARATDAYESAREKVRRFLNASSTNEIVFVRGATEGINLIAQSWGRRNIRKDDEIVITWLEHHANIVPWQMLCSETGAKLRVAPVDDSGQVLLDEYEKLLGPRTRLVSLTQVSNALGVVTPAAQMIEVAHHYGATVLLDGAQSVSHMRTDVQSLDCDFFVFSGHKVFGPTGIGAVYGKPNVLEHMPAWQGGGNMIQDVTFEKTTFHGPPQRFEAGTGNIADAVGLGAAIDYLDRVGMNNVARHEHDLLLRTTAELERIPGLRIIGTAKEKAGVISFILEGFRTDEVGSHLNRNGIAVRSGHHCAQPILRRFGYESTVRASFALYNTHEDIDRLVRAVWDLRLGRTSIT
ncbi:MAG: family 2A encapsulin nanocompartment cargo protein cysteine desulfurase [Edaphobacter sp.]|uniref:family 2A encapsulin nanocompartment cargo protein cysteine desulfurase n=1 Tax=Edaphobacter sp. TaxID=1934404 RepID=UPI00239F61DB|nr:family 2A encapsulin nanocompartment cargo protein cysteine desulfurase [Edaphobacter sp.]MDE1175703.1 family 2A encapsulin nanocompartment cargo protein cysteine desulfurase [Edaphobacter sp.]